MVLLFNPCSKFETDLDSIFNLASKIYRCPGRVHSIKYQHLIIRNLVVFVSNILETIATLHGIEVETAELNILLEQLKSVSVEFMETKESADFISSLVLYSSYEFYSTLNPYDRYTITNGLIYSAENFFCDFEQYFERMQCSWSDNQC